MSGCAMACRLATSVMRTRYWDVHSEARKPPTVLGCRCALGRREGPMDPRLEDIQGAGSGGCEAN